MSPPVADLPYRRACIADTQCTETERRAALVDWVGAVYLDGSQSPECTDHVAIYDNRLSAAEARCAKMAIGALPQVNAEAVAAFFERARQWYFDHLPTRVANASVCARPIHRADGDCPSRGPCTIWPLSVQGHTHSPNGSTEWFTLGAYKNCPIEFARLFYESGAELAVAAHTAPDSEEQWVFFIEGYNQFLTHRSAAGDARGYFARIAAILHVPIYDAIQRTYRHPDVIDLAARYSLFRPDQLLTVTYLADYLDRARAGEPTVTARAAVTQQIVADGHAAIVPGFLDEVEALARGIVNLHDRFFMLENAEAWLMPSDQQRILRQEYSGGRLHVLCVANSARLGALNTFFPTQR